MSNGTALEDINTILAAFPRRFTVKDVEERFDWSTSRARQAIVMGQQNDAIVVLFQPKNETGVSGHAIYENLTWRKQWVTRAWRTHEPDMDSKEQRHG